MEGAVIPEDGCEDRSFATRFLRLSGDRKGQSVGALGMKTRNLGCLFLTKDKP